MGEPNLYGRKTSFLSRHPILILGLTAFVVIIVAVLALYVFRTPPAIQAKYDAIREAGLPLTPEEFDAWYPPPPPDENAAPLITRASKLYSGHDAEVLLPFLDDGQLPAPSEPLPEAMLDGMKVFLAQNEDAFALLYTAAQQPHYRGIEEGSILVFIMEALDALSYPKYVRMMCLDALYRAETGDLEAAVQALAASVKLGDIQHEEPEMGSQLMRVSCLSLSTEGLEAILSRYSMTEPQLEELQHVFARAAEQRSLWRFFVRKQCRVIDSKEPSFRRAFWRSTSNRDGIPWERLSQLNALRTSMQEEYIQLLEGIETLIDAAQGPPEEAIVAVAHLRPESEEEVDQTDYSQLLRDPIDVLDAQIVSVAYCRAAAAGLAVERFRLAHGSYPERLEQLIQANLDVELTDPFSNAPLRYRHEDSGFVISSVGPDGGELDMGNEWPAFTVKR